MAVTVKGGFNIRRNLERYKALSVKEQRGRMREACMEVQRRSQLVVPVDVGNLKNSCETRVVHTASGVRGQIMYLAAYAAFVHENLRARHNPGKRAKFLQGPLQDSTHEVARILGGRA